MRNFYKAVEDGKELSDTECNQYGVSTNDKTKQICIKDPNENKCDEKYFCEFVPKSTTEIDCSNYPVKIENTDTHNCVNNSNWGKYHA